MGIDDIVSYVTAVRSKNRLRGSSLSRFYILRPFLDAAFSPELLFNFFRLRLFTILLFYDTI